MSNYKVGDKVVLTVTDKDENGFYPIYVLNDNFYISEQGVDEHTEPLSTYIESLEDKIRRQAKEITRLLIENKELKEENKKLFCKVDSYELYGDQHEEEYNQAFNQGTEAAWELARKIILNGEGFYSDEDLKEIFECGFNCRTVMRNYTYSEAAAKVAEWEKAKEEINIGDIVKIYEGNDNDLCVLYVSTDKKYYNAVDEYGAVYNMLTKGMIIKTGRHIDIDNFLKQIGGE